MVDRRGKGKPKKSGVIHDTEGYEDG